MRRELRPFERNRGQLRLPLRLPLPLGSRSGFSKAECALAVRHGTKYQKMQYRYELVLGKWALGSRENSTCAGSAAGAVAEPSTND